MKSKRNGWFTETDEFSHLSGSRFQIYGDYRRTDKSSRGTPEKIRKEVLEANRYTKETRQSGRIYKFFLRFIASFCFHGDGN